MKTIFCVVILFVAFTSKAIKADEINDDWPCYMKKCGKSSANLEKCLVQHANRALDSVIQGDPTIGIPLYNEYNLGDVFFGQNESFKLYLENSKIYGIKHLHVTGFKWNFCKKMVKIDFLYNSAIIISGEYNSTGTFKGVDITGEGDMDMIFVGGSNGANLTYNMNYELLKVSGRDYVQIKDRTCTRAEGFRLNFSNKYKSRAQVARDLAYINKNNRAANKNISEVIAEIICKLVDKALNPVFYNFPLDLMFDK